MPSQYAMKISIDLKGLNEFRKVETQQKIDYILGYTLCNEVGCGFFPGMSIFCRWRKYVIKKMIGFALLSQLDIGRKIFLRVDKSQKSMDNRNLSKKDISNLQSLREKALTMTRIN